MSFSYETKYIIDACYKIGMAFVALILMYFALDAIISAVTYLADLNIVQMLKDVPKEFRFLAFLITYYIVFSIGGQLFYMASKLMKKVQE